MAMTRIPDLLVLRDLRYAFRSLARTPVFTAAAVLALALGVGATTAMLSVVNGVLLRPLPYADADRLVVILHNGRNPVAPANVADWKAQTRSFVDIAAAEAWGPNLMGDTGPERLSGLRLTGGMFPLLGVRPLMGRFFTADEDAPGKENVAVISFGLWQRRWGGSRDVIGRRVSLDDRAFTIIGVMPRGFQFAPFWITSAEIWAPLALGARASNRSGQSLRAFARLRPGVSLEQARVDLAAVTARLEREYPGTNGDVTLQTLKHKVVGSIQRPLLVLLVAVAFVLLIACANVAHMLLARASSRQKEIAIRTALGATPRRIVRQLLTESIMLAIAGGVGGLALATWGIRALIAASPAIVPRVADVRMDLRVLAMSALVTAATAIVFGLVPAVRAARVDLAETFKDGDRGSSEGRGRHRLRNVLVASEFSLALVLLVGAGLMIRTFGALRRVDPGFEPRGVVTMTIATTGTRAAAPAQRVPFFNDLLPRIRALPGVESAAFINHLPIAGDQWGAGFSVEGRPHPPKGHRLGATFRVVTPGYFHTMRIPLRQGRDISDSDRLDAPLVVVINEFMAKTHWPGENPIGKRISLDDSTWMTVVGVAKNAVRSDWAAPPEEELFIPFAQSVGFNTNPGAHFGYLTLVARAACWRDRACDAAVLATSMVQLVRATDRSVPIAAVQTMSQVVQRATAESAFYLVLLGAFASIAVILAAVGIYGVMSYTVSRRTHEIGIRIALGAAPSAVRGFIVLQGLRVVVAGAAAGVVAAFALTRLMSGLLYGLTASDPLTFVAVTLTLCCVAALASYLPARRATRIDPLQALRAD
jgi:predicted permease